MLEGLKTQKKRDTLVVEEINKCKCGFINDPIHKHKKIDLFLRNLVTTLNESLIKTYSCCSGHGKYHPTIIIDNVGHWKKELFSGVVVPRKTRFYITDSNSLYYIPEVEKFWKEQK